MDGLSFLTRDYSNFRLEAFNGLVSSSVEPKKFCPIYDCDGALLAGKLLVDSLKSLASAISYSI